MEDKHKELLQTHRRVFINHIDADKFLPLLEKSNVFDGNDLVEISRQSSNIGRVEKILDILPTKSTSAFHKLCVALEGTYPNLLTMMFLGNNQNVSDGGSVNLPTSSDGEGRHQSPIPSCGLEASGITTYTRIIPSYEYDLQPDNQSPPPLSLDDASTYTDPTVHYRLDSYSPLSLLQADKHRDYDWLKTKCEKAMTELQTLKRQHGESIKRCDQSMKEADYYRNKYKTALSQLEQESVAVNDMRGRYDNLLTDKSRVEQELIELKKAHDEDKQEMVNLRQEQRTTVMQTDNNEALKSMCDNALDKYEACQADYDLVRGRYSAVMSEYTAAARKIDQLQEELARVNKQKDDVTKDHNALVIERNGLKKQSEEVIQERNMVIAECNSFKQHCSSLSRSWDMAVLERTKLKDALAKVTLQRDEVLKELNNSMHGQIRVKHDMAQAEEERNAALHEYSLIMSERDCVHKEIEQLQEQLQNAIQGADQYRVDVQKLQNENESLRREIECALQDRDRGMKECNQLREKYGGIATEKEVIQKERDEFMNDYIIASKERDVARKEKHEAIDYRDKMLREAYEKTQKAKLEEIDLVNKEVDLLNKQVEKLQKEVTDAQQETEIAKKRRDWAFSERDKIVQERDSVRMLCDKLRRERDRSISDLAQAIRDSDDVKKQKLDACQKLSDWQLKYGSVMDGEGQSRTSCRDLADKVDDHGCEMEAVHLNIGGMSSSEVGFDVEGGVNDPQFTNDSSLYVSRIIKSGPADGYLRLNDVVVKVNTTDLTNVDKGVLYQTIYMSSSIVSLMIKRKKKDHYLAPIQRDVIITKDSGVLIQQGLYVSRISPSSTLARESNLHVGDRLLSVDGRSVVGMNASDVLHMMRQSGEGVKIEVWRGTHHSPSISLSPPCTPTSSHPDRGFATSDSNRSSLKNVRCNGSQTDSLNSPLSDRRKERQQSKESPSRNKSNRSLESSGGGGDTKHKHSGHLFDKVHKMLFGESKDSVGVGKITEDDVIAEFDSVLKTYDEPVQKYKRGRGAKIGECHGGTWPKQQHLKMEANQSTICAEQMPRRPQLPPSFMSSESTEGPVYHKVPPQPPQRNDSSFAASIFHSPQNSDSSVRYNPTQTHKSTPIVNMAQARMATPSHLNKSGPIAIDYTSKRHSAFEPGFSQPGSGFMSQSSQDKATIVDMSVKSSNNNQVINEHVQRMKSRNPACVSPPAVSLSSARKPKPGALHIKKGKNMDSKPISKFGNPMLEMTLISIENSVSVPVGVGTGRVSATRNVIPHSRPPLINLNMYDNGSVMVRSRSPATPIMSLTDTSRPPPSPRYSSPPDVLLDMINVINRDQAFSPVSLQSTSPCPSQMSTSMIETRSPMMHEDYIYPRHYQRTSPYGRPMSEYSDGRSTIPRRGHERIRIPSNTSITPKSSVSKISTGSAEIIGSGHSSPLTSFMPINNTGRNSVNSLISPTRDLAAIPVQPKTGETRHINIEKTTNLVGLKIDTGPNGGIFVSAVTEKSLAEQAGVVIGDQILEFCGINMRNATLELATSVLRQACDDFDMLVQFNPDKFYERCSERSTPVMSVSLHSHFMTSADKLRSTPMSASATAALDNCDSMSSVGSMEQGSDDRHSSNHSSILGSDLMDMSASSLQGITSTDYSSITRSDQPIKSVLNRHTMMSVDKDRRNSDDHMGLLLDQRIIQAQRSAIPDRMVQSVHGALSEISDHRLVESQHSSIADNMNESRHSSLVEMPHELIMLTAQSSIPERMVQSVHGALTDISERVTDQHHNIYSTLPMRDRSGDHMFARDHTTRNPLLRENTPSSRKPTENMHDLATTRDLSVNVREHASTTRDITATKREHPPATHDLPTIVREHTPTHSPSTREHTPTNRVTRSHHVSDRSSWIQKQLVSGGKSIQQSSPVSRSPVVSNPRVVYIEKDPETELGITIIGGNAAGIFVHKLDYSCLTAGPQGLQQGDHILEYNGVNLRSLTLEEATNEIRKSCSKVSLVVQRNSLRYNQVCKQRAGDHFYIRTHFDRSTEHEGELSFKQDDILLVEDTQYEGKQGLWFAWLLGDDRRKIQGGTIPSKLRLDDEFIMRQSLTDSLHDDEFKNRRSSGSARRSFFRRKKHQRNNSKDSREFSSVSDASLNSDSVPVLDEVPFCAYTKVEQVDQSMVRPVVILAPLAEPLINKLTAESPDMYSRVTPVVMKSSAQVMENGINNSVFVHYWKSDDHYECITMSAVKELCDKQCHCLLNVPPGVVDNLQKARVYPIVIFCQHKSIKQIREVKDAQFQPERLPNKAARDLMDHYQKIEQDYRHLFSGSIQGGNLAEMVTQIKRIINTEQQRTLWVPVSC